MASMHELICRVAEENGVFLTTGSLTQALRIDDEHQPRYRGIPKFAGYVDELIGPLYDPNDEDVRVFISHTVFDGSETIQVLVQDATDGAWLNSGAEGVEKWPTGRALYV